MGSQIIFKPGSEHSLVFGCNLSGGSHGVWGISALELSCLPCLSVIHRARISVEEPGPAMASCYTEPSTLSAWIQDEDEEEKEPKSPQRSSSDESEESEPEPSLASVVRRKVSFADAFGLDLVSVKEFDNRVESAEGREGEEYHLSCIFSVPNSDEELKLRLWQNKLELESIELLPGSTTIRGTVRVLNLSYHKVVYVRTTLDGWQSHFDQLAEYVPGSSDGETDRFSFQLTLMPPFPPSGARLEFCLCYESSTGIFWANNGGMNYVLFCHKRGRRTLKEKEGGKERETEENDQKGKKSCLKAIKKGSCAESKPTDKNGELSEQESPRSVENQKGKTQHIAESRSRDALEENCKTLTERRNRRRAAQLAHLQDYFSHRDTEVQLGQPSHQEKSKRDLNVVLPMPQHSIPVMTDTSSTLQVCSRKEQNGNTSSILPDHQIPLLPLDWGRNISSPPLSHPNTSEIISGTKPDALEKERTEDVSTEFSNDAWKAFLSGTDSIDNQNNDLNQKCLLCVAGSNDSQASNTEYDVSNIGDKVLSVWSTQESAVTSGNGSHQCFTAMETLESDPAELSQALDPSHISEVLSYKDPEKAQIISEPHTVQESESIWAQWMPGVTEAPHDRHILSERPFSEDKPMLLTNPGQTAHAEDATEPLYSKSGNGVLLEECASSTGFLDTEMKVKGDTYRVVEDILTFNGISKKPFTDSRESLERQYIDESKKPTKKKENEKVSQMKRISWSEYSEDALVVLESRLQTDEQEPSCLKDENTEIWISSRTSVVCDEGEPHKQTECLDRGEEGVVCYELVKKGFSDSSERQGEEISSVENIANRECENGLKTEGQGIYGRQNEGDDYTDNYLHKELHKLQSSPETCPHAPNLCITSHTSSPPGHFTWTESVSEGELLLFPAPHKGFESEETLRYRVAPDLQDPGVGTEFPSSFSRTASPSVGTMSSWLLVCWAKISTLSYIAGALMCAILFVIFVTAYLHDFPVCLAIYLLSACWWCRQGMKKHVTTADSVD
ncbi:uncharacterized protein ppp1r3aa [Pangasianodon hypophthalmus]|uniref:uncharacterized protein ppp1r3aa n=1 Tax=Pangasianodon hypophthalmus TaxID=310915 RepID=UPI00230701E3|nr:uncharacterized protein ppp1r3aa [Pangasianodon hypophthalmus]